MPELTNDKGQRICGAETRHCLHCGHHQRHHAVVEETGRKRKNTRRGPCEAPGCEGCPGFKGRPHSFVVEGSPNGRCRQHGGASLSGVAHPGYQGKGRSKYLARHLPENMARDFDKLIEDEDRLSLQAESAMLGAMLMDLWRRFEDYETVPTEVSSAASAVEAAWRAQNVAARGGDAAAMATAMTAMQDAVGQLSAARSRAVAQRQTFDDVLKVTDRIEKVKRSENTRLVELHGMVSLEASMTIMRQLITLMLDASAKHAPVEIAKAIRRDVAAGYARLAGRRDPQALDAGGGPVVGVAVAPASDD